MKYLLYLFLSLLIVTSACNDSVIVGSELLGSEEVDVDFVDDLLITSRTVLGDSTLTFRKLSGDNYSSSTYLVGSISDPTFGSTETTTYFSPGQVSSFPTLTQSNLDSVVMVLALDSVGGYGDPEAVHDLTLSVLEERMDIDDREDFYSNLELSALLTTLHTTSTKFNYNDSLTVNQYVQDSLVRVAPQLRFRLDNQFWINLRSNLIDTTDESSLLDLIPGFELKSSTTNSMGAIDLGFNESISPSNLLFYYSRGDTTNLIYNLPLGKYRHSHITKDYSGSTLQNDLDKTDVDCLYLESQGGTNLVVDFSSIGAVDDLILNHASLEITVKSFNEDQYPAIEGIAGWYKNDEGEFARADNANLPALLEETYPRGEQRWSYSLDLSSYITQLRNGTLDNSELYIIALSKSERANRSVIYGANDPDNPMKLNLILTKP